jgi:hypothetical protein
MERYAESCRADFLPIKDMRLRLPYPHHEKMRLFDILSRYEQVLFLDADIAVNAAVAPDIFASVGLDEFAIFDEEGFCKDIPQRAAVFSEARALALKQIGDTDWQREEPSRIHRASRRTIRRQMNDLKKKKPREQRGIGVL